MKNKDFPNWHKFVEEMLGKKPPQENKEQEKGRNGKKKK